MGVTGRGSACLLQPLRRKSGPHGWSLGKGCPGREGRACVQNEQGVLQWAQGAMWDEGSGSSSAEGAGEPRLGMTTAAGDGVPP